jgi:hypothetical protein
LSHFKALEAPRIDRTKRYPLIEIIFLIISATISGCEGWKSIRDFGVLKLDWLKQYLSYENGVPVDDTIDAVALETSLKRAEQTDPSRDRQEAEKLVRAKKLGGRIKCSAP